MIINIPLQIDELKMEEVLQRDYQGKILDRIESYIKNSLKSYSQRYYCNSEDNKVKDGMDELIMKRIDCFLEAHRDEVINSAGVALAEKLVRTKKGKALLDEVSKQ